MAVKWTDVTKVRARLKIAGTPLTDAEITKFIEENEGWLEVWIKDTAVSLAAPDLILNKAHLFGSKIVELMTVLDIIGSTPNSFQTLEHAALAADIASDSLAQYKQTLEKMGAADFVRKGGS